MNKRDAILAGAAALAFMIATPPALAQSAKLVFRDPAGDDHGPAGYIYPTDSAYKRGSFDLVEAAVTPEADSIEFSAKLASTLEDPWRTGAGYSVQMIFIFIDTDNVAGSGHTEGVPGLNVTFDPAHAWDRVVVLAPLEQSRVDSEASGKAPQLAGDIVSTTSRGRGQVISARVPRSALGGGDPATWSYQVVMQSNDSFPAATALLTRKVNEVASEHRFGGGTDFDCDPHVIDVLAGEARGDASEIAAQHGMLAYKCGPNGEPLRLATLSMVHR